MFRCLVRHLAVASAVLASLATTAVAQERERGAGVGRGWSSGQADASDDPFAQQVAMKRMTDVLYDRYVNRTHRRS
jgi:hypothetical protein